jgi:hypothetical protein
MIIASVPFTENFVDWLWIALGVVLAILWPPLRRAIASAFGRQTAAAGEDLRKAGLLLAFAAATAILVLAVYRAARPDEHILWYAGLLAGVGWEATLEKVTGFTPEA